MELFESFFRFEAIDETDMGAQWLVKISPVDLATVDISQDDDGVLQVTEKAAVVAPLQPGAKYRLEPEGGLFRLYAVRGFGSVCAGARGGLVEGEHNLSHEGVCWVADESTVTGRIRVEGDAKVRTGCTLAGRGLLNDKAVVASTTFQGGDYGCLFVKDSATLMSCTVNVTDVSLSFEGSSQVADTVFEPEDSLRVAGCNVRGGHIRNCFEVVSVDHPTWGWLSAYRDRSSNLRFSVGCEDAEDAQALLRLADRHDIDETHRAMLDGFIAMAQAAADGWVKQPQLEPPLTEAQPVPSFTDFAQRAREVATDHATLLRDQIHAANPPQAGGVLRRNLWD